MTTLNIVAVRDLLKHVGGVEGGRELFEHFCNEVEPKYSHVPDHWLFVNEALNARGVIPDEWRIATWFSWCYRKPFLGRIEYSPGDVTQYTALIDNPNFLLQYRREKHSVTHKYLFGIELFEYLCLPTRENMWVGEALVGDEVPKFGIQFAMHGSILRKNFIRAVVLQQSTNCLLWLMKEQKDFFSCYPSREFLFLICANANDTMGPAVIEHMMSRFPNIFRKLSDEFGNTPLWYLFHNSYADWWKPECKMVQLLIQAGCDPDAVNHLGFSFQKIVNCVTDCQSPLFGYHLRKNYDYFPF